MENQRNPTTSKSNGKLWGARARDWANFQEGTLQPVFATVLSRLGITVSTRYLDIGCGAGMAAKLASGLGARISGVDASEAMLTIARERTPGGDFHIGDLEELPHQDETFDGVTAFNSIQYAGNPAIALAEARRVTKPGGKVAIVTWGDTEHMEAARFNASLKPLMPAPPPNTPGPFALSDEAALREFATGAGLTPLEVFDIDAPWTYPDFATAIRAVTSAGVVVRAMEILGEDVVTKTYTAALAEFRQPDGSYRIEARFRCLLAVRE